MIFFFFLKSFYRSPSQKNEKTTKKVLIGRSHVLVFHTILCLICKNWATSFAHFIFASLLSLGIISLFYLSDPSGGGSWRYSCIFDWARGDWSGREACSWARSPATWRQSTNHNCSYLLFSSFRAANECLQASPLWFSQGKSDNFHPYWSEKSRWCSSICLLIYHC